MTRSRHLCWSSLGRYIGEMAQEKDRNLCFFAQIKHLCCKMGKRVWLLVLLAVLSSAIEATHSRVVTLQDNPGHSLSMYEISTRPWLYRFASRNTRCLVQFVTIHCTACLKSMAVPSPCCHKSLSRSFKRSNKQVNISIKYFAKYLTKYFSTGIDIVWMMVCLSIKSINLTLA